MGSDDLFKKRKAKKTSELKRKKYCEPYKRILIVCEGGKTEPNYFIGLRNHYRLSTANIEIAGDECGSDPKSVVKHAKKRFREENKAGNPFDEVYCVFDKDCHPNYQEAINDIQNFRPENTFFSITSVPCFEYWLLLHFTYTTKPYLKPTSSDSSSAELIKQLKQYLPEYEKGKINVFNELQKNLDTAIANSKKSLEAAENQQIDNPSTKVHILVEKLKNLNKR
ncbi:MULTISPECIES: RloB family protein [unclassified Neisseria]|uniref:RloB family protein n=1 Tax=unclassified Neisseria TaxID=2623750 RepID=UPI0026660C2D|nr:MULTISPECIES: RloB family protein [unclassified Neisseria]MDO1510407.1 RloB family protein [Neisseria sp. MVDL19-042950]MDO1516576.1 RloB family protein [Neisseria sp. MVDL18-041461]MDO1563633.1 RloB family protein [Neisseria sp. MVDL20-010259]